MNTEINAAAHCYIGYVGQNPACFFAVLHFPHPSVKNMKKGHRLVVLPDYQGLGIGHQFSTAIAAHYKRQGFRFVITSSTKALYKQRASDARWAITSKGRVSAQGKSHKVMSVSRNKLTYSYEFVG